MNGTITKLILDRGFGFIASPGRKDVFFHCSDLINLTFDETLVELPVEFEVVESNDRPHAVEVRPAAD